MFLLWQRRFSVSIQSKQKHNKLFGNDVESVEKADSMQWLNINESYKSLGKYDWNGEAENCLNKASAAFSI